MGGIITALRFQKGDKERVNVYLDEQFAFALPAVEAARLRKGQELSDDEIERLKALDAEARAYERAVRFLGYRPRSVAEVEHHLREHQMDEPVVRRVISRLQAAGYLDDEGFARFWVENRQQFNPRGAGALRHELRLKGVAPDVIEETLRAADVDEETAAYQSISAKAKHWRELDRAAFWKKAGGYLARRGFSYEVIESVLGRLWAQRQADEESSQ
jgi:regulatory protein